MNLPDIQNRKGRVVLKREFLLTANEQLLKEIFSNFFPIASPISTHDRYFYDSVLFYGLSPDFEIVEEACIAPTYNIVCSVDENDVYKFEKMEIEPDDFATIKTVRS